MRTIVTIGREFGSGGREIGRKLADYYHISFYDKELLTRVAKESGYAKEFVKEQDERPTSSFLYNLVMDTYSFGTASLYSEMPVSQKLFLAQFDTIRRIADTEGSCVFIGRCADGALEEYPNVLNVFIHADMDYRIHRIMNIKAYRSEADTEQKARQLIQRTDRQRASYYNYYSNGRWGQASTYDLTINAGKLGINGSVSLLIQAVEDFEQARMAKK